MSRVHKGVEHHVEMNYCRNAGIITGRINNRVVD
eukprot:XP_001705322.1 Hypothetical protein GL50803_35562 [Giardia lamblia ATCC 50803]